MQAARHGNASTVWFSGLKLHLIVQDKASHSGLKHYAWAAPKGVTQSRKQNNGAITTFREISHSPVEANVPRSMAQSMARICQI